MGCAGYCGSVEEDYDYVGGDLRFVDFVPDTGTCCSVCRAEPNCTAWTWRKRADAKHYGRCTLKHIGQLRRERDPDLIAGLPGSNSMRFVFQDHAGRCLRHGGHDASGSLVLGGCHTQAAADVRWAFSLVTGQVQAATGRCLAAPASNSHQQVMLQPCDWSDVAQRWHFSSQGGQLKSGQRCLFAPPGNDEVEAMALGPCNLPYSRGWRMWSAKAFFERMPELAGPPGPPPGGEHDASQQHALDAIAGAARSRSSTTTQRSGDGEARGGDEAASGKAVQHRMTTTTRPTSTASPPSSTADVTTTTTPPPTSTSTGTQTRTTTTPTTTTQTTTSSTTEAPLTMLCFMVMIPTGYEPDLVRMQFSSQTGIFACDEWAVYTNEHLNLNGLVPTQVNIDLHSELRGKFHTFYNTAIFIGIWQQVILEARYLVHEFTVKADPDAVILPVTLRKLLRLYVDDGRLERAEAGNGMFLNNCKFGMHGPMEVASRMALSAYAAGSASCARPPQEDVYLQKCLVSLGVKQYDDFRLMVEDHCDPPIGWDECKSGHAVFHPFKDVEGFRTCERNAAMFAAAGG